MNIFRFALIAMLFCGSSSSCVIASETSAPAGASGTDTQAAVESRIETKTKIPTIDLKVFSIDLKSRLGMDYSGKVVELNAMMEIGFGIKFPDADKHFIAYENVVLDQIVMSSGEKLAPLPDTQPAGDAMWSTFSERRNETQHFFFRAVKLPIKPSGQISKMTGHVHLDLGIGRLEEQALDALPDASSRTMVLKEFPDVPIEFSRAKNTNGIKVEIDSSLNSHLLNIFFYDKAGKQIKVGGMSGEGQNNSKVARRVYGQFPADVSIKVFYYPKMHKHRWAFEINDVPMPQSVRINSQHTVTVELKPIHYEPVELNEPVEEETGLHE